MSISLIAIRIVLADASKGLKHNINFIADKYQSMSLASGDELTHAESGLGAKESDQRQPRDITIEVYEGSNSADKKSDIQDSMVTSIPFCIGNHYVEVIQGVLHLYKENKSTPLGEEAERSDIICMLSVTASKTIHDILQFTAPFNQDILHIQIIRDSQPNQYMVLLKFNTQRSADEFYNSLNGTAYNSIEPEVCHLAYVAKIEVMEESKDSSFLPITGFTELPTCPVCLERMDESVQGILTILCNHSFHGKCLDQWYDSSCPVCRYCQTPEEMPDNRCFECGSQSTTQDTLWICLICGHIGCGRYLGGHAYKHYKDTQHTYAMQLGHNNRVWDYAGDNYVHRLLQNKDGEPVEHKVANNNNNNTNSQEEKIDSVQLEYTYLLTSQLENQRHYYEDSMIHLEKEKQQQIEERDEANRFLKETNHKLTTEVDALKKSKQQLERKVTQLTAKLAKTQQELEEEKELNKCLRKNQEEWTKRLVDTERNLLELRSTKDTEVNELREQIRDLMFYLEAKDKLASVPETSQEEIEGGQIYIQQSSSSSSSSSTTAGSKAKSGKNRKGK